MPDLKRAHELFCREYAAGVNGAEAARRAGYAPDSARQTAYELLERPDVVRRIAELEAEAIDRRTRAAAALAARLDPVYDASLADDDRQGVLQVVALQAHILGLAPGAMAARPRAAHPGADGRRAPTRPPSRRRPERVDAAEAAEPDLTNPDKS